MELQSPSAPAAAPEKRFWLGAFIAGKQIRFCILIALVVVLMPPETGLGVDLCMLHRQTGAPCPGCGVTRSGANLVRGNFRRAFDYHPLGYILHPILLGLVCLSVLPSATRAVIARKMLPWQRVLRLLNAAFWIVFFAFGIVRFVAVLAGWMSFPPNWLSSG